MNILTHDEILWWLRKFRYDSEYRTATARTIPMTPFCRYCGVNAEYIRKVMSGQEELRNMGPMTRERLTHGIEAVKNGLRFHRVDHKWVPVGQAMLEREQINRQKKHGAVSNVLLFKSAV